MKKNQVVLYVVVTYVVFLLSILIAGVFVFTSKNPMVSKYVVIPCSWTPTLVLFLLFPKLNPEITRKEFLKNLFKEKLNYRLLFKIFAVQVIILFLCLLCVSHGENMMEYLSLSGGAFAWNVFYNISTGATGEEAGWRGYLHPILIKKYGLLKGAALLGVIWGFWHAPLWFITSGYSGLLLVKYIVCFLIFIMADAIIISVCYEKNHNILLPMGIHFGTNFALSFYKGDVINIILYLAVFYVIAAVYTYKKE